jgi:hypothetical protein
MHPSIWAKLVILRRLRIFEPLKQTRMMLKPGCSADPQNFIRNK